MPGFLQYRDVSHIVEREEVVDVGEDDVVIPKWAAPDATEGKENGIQDLEDDNGGVEGEIGGVDQVDEFTLFFFVGVVKKSGSLLGLGCLSVKVESLLCGAGLGQGWWHRRIRNDNEAPRGLFSRAGGQRRQVWRSVMVLRFA